MKEVNESHNEERQCLWGNAFEAMLKRTNAKVTMYCNENQWEKWIEMMWECETNNRNHRSRFEDFDFLSRVVRWAYASDCRDSKWASRNVWMESALLNITMWCRHIWAMTGQNSWACQMCHLLQNEAATYLARASFTSGSLCSSAPEWSGWAGLMSDSSEFLPLFVIRAARFDVIALMSYKLYRAIAYDCALSSQDVTSSYLRLRSSIVLAPTGHMTWLDFFRDIKFIQL